MCCEFHWSQAHETASWKSRTLAYRDWRIEAGSRRCKVHMREEERNHMNGQLLEGRKRERARYSFFVASGRRQAKCHIDEEKMWPVRCLWTCINRDPIDTEKLHRYLPIVFSSPSSCPWRERERGRGREGREEKGVRETHWSVSSNQLYDVMADERFSWPGHLTWCHLQRRIRGRRQVNKAVRVILVSLFH